MDSGRVVARPGKAGDQTKADRVFANAEDDRDRCGGSFGRLGASAEAGYRDHGHAAADEVSHDRGQAVVLAVQPVVRDHHVLALDGAGFVEAFMERGRIARGAIGRPNADEADDRHRRLLRARRKRPRRRGTKQRDELASLHSITSSAMASSPGGKLRPNAPAVLRLITNSNLIDCMTGRSAGFSPLRIRPVYTPAWRYASLRLVP